MAETIILDKEFGDGGDYNLMIVSGYGFTDGATVTITVTDQQSEVHSTVHDTITVDSEGRFNDEKVWLPRIPQTGDVTITATPSAGSPATKTYKIRYCNSTTPNDMGRKINMVKQAQNETDFFDTTSTPTEEAVELMIRQAEELWEKETAVPIRNKRVKRYFDTDGTTLCETRVFPILKVYSAKFYNGSEYESFQDSWQRERNEEKGFWWDRFGTIRFETQNPDRYREGLYLDFVTGPDELLDRSIIQAIEAKVCSVMLNNKEYYKVFRFGGMEVDVIDKRNEFAQIWKDTVGSFRRQLRRVG